MSRDSKVAAIMASTAAVVIVSMLAMLLISKAAIRANSDLIVHHKMIGGLQELLSTLKDAEKTGQRGYLLTGNEEYLRPYDVALGRIGQELAALGAAEKAGAVSPTKAHELAHLIHKKLDELQKTIFLRHDQGLPAALAIVMTDYGKKTMDQVRAVTSVLIVDQENKLATANRTAAGLRFWQNLVAGGSGILAIGVLLWAYRRIQEETLGRQRSALEVLRQRDLLDVTLASIGDGVIVTDTNSKVTFLNKVAEQLTGWTAAEARNQPCEKIFKIINESSRLLLESPVTKVLREGTVVGLANHSVLIRQDGTEIPIDDSGAPIKEADGTIRGAVLIFRDFSEYKASENKMREINNALTAANQAKDQFLAALSHELRTPLTPVLATLTSWETSDQLPHSLLASVQMLRRNVELEARLIDDLLDLSRIVKGKLSLNLELVNVHELLEDALSMLQSQIRFKRLTVARRLEATRYFVKADSARIQQVFINVLSNAVKFTERDGHISVITGDDIEGHIIIKVSDDGIGMNRELLERLFQPFEQGPIASERYGGLGLGMAISKALVDVQAGTISADSQGLGHGAEITITLPCIHATATAKLRGASRYDGQKTRALRILFVEDHEDTAEVIGELLRYRGHEVHACGTLAEALAALEKQDFDLLLSDIGLPDGTGIDLIRSVRRRSSMPAIALTGFGMDREIDEYKEAGFDANITKPVSIQKLDIIIHQMFG